MDKAAALGIDVGGTKTLCVLVDKRCRILKEVKFKTAPREGPKEFTKSLLEANKNLEQAAHRKGYVLIGIGVGCAGLVDHEERSIKTSPNLLRLEDYPIGKHLRNAFKVEVVRAPGGLTARS